ncbi:hypothetical protein CEXT_24961 [Caerostris extrusa]|uniref:Uncharacterized protein n=1 Tax=Caerostris extrusa TaxID=172846 RepID=A0AAV4TP01_CAEEX|nr:hypothetical protein CEXT_24961 [Caerostris extrusa]
MSNKFKVRDENFLKITYERLPGQYTTRWFEFEFQEYEPDLSSVLGYLHEDTNTWEFSLICETPEEPDFSDSASFEEMEARRAHIVEFNVIKKSRDSQSSNGDATPYQCRRSKQILMNGYILFSFPVEEFLSYLTSSTSPPKEFEIPLDS